MAFALQQTKNGTLVAELCRNMGDVVSIEEAPCRMGVWVIRRLKQLEEKKAKLKRLAADLSLDLTTLI